MTTQSYVWIFLILLYWTPGIHTACHPLDDIYFRGIYGPLYIREHKCVNISYFEVPNYINLKTREDALLIVENSNIGTLNPDFFPDSKALRVITLSLINCQISSLEKESIRKLGKLYNLTMYNNDIPYFDSSFIKANNQRFRHLNLTRNNVKIVGDLCTGVPTLKVVALRENSIENITDDVFKNCQNLEYLDLSKNPLKSISDNAFSKNLKLTQLIIQNAGFKNLEQIYKSAPNLTSLDLSYNNLTTFDTLLFKYFPSVKILYLSHNFIKSSSVSYEPPESFGIRQLYLNNNNITNWNLSYFKELQTLDLSNNLIESLSVHYFEFCTDLRHLLLRNNKISTLPIGLFSPVTEMVQLDLSYNMLTTLDPHVLSSISMVEHLDLSGNKAIPISVYDLWELSNLKKLYFFDFPWTCPQLTSYLKYCSSYKIVCKDSSKLNFKYTNVQGIPCTEPTTTSEPVSPATDEPDENINEIDNTAKLVAPSLDVSSINNNFFKYFNANLDFQRSQVSMYQEHLHIQKLAYIIIVLMVMLTSFIAYKTFSPSCGGRFFRPKRELRPSSNISNIELLNPNCSDIN